MTKIMKDEDIEKITLEHQLEEWKLLNDYINKIDIGYQQSITIIVSVFAIIATVLSKDANQWMWGIFIIPLGLTAFFSYVSYHFRITAILRGHLAELEEDMNAKMRKDVHLWNSLLVETFMAHNNSINKMMMAPIIGFLFLIIGYCIKITFYLLISKNDSVEFGIIWFILYWVVVAIFICIVFIPFLKNEEIRYETLNKNRVFQKYFEYKRVENNSRKSFVYEKVNKKNNLNRNILFKCFCLSFGVFAIGFGVLNIFWIKYSGNKSLKGFYDYYAAIIGDGIFLPLLIGAGYYFLNINNWNEYIRNCNGDKKLVNTLGSIATTIAILIQVSWLVSSSTELNWTIDRLHHFNVAGWYHAIYFVFMSCIIARTIGKVSLLKLKKKDQILGIKCYVLIWVSIHGYLLMHIMDDWLNQNNYWYLIIICTIVMVVVFCVFEKNKRVVIKYSIIVSLMSSLMCCYCYISGLRWNVLQMFKNAVMVIK